MADRLTIALTLEGQAPTQYLNYPFTTAVRFNGELVLFGDTGIFERGGGLDHQTKIDAHVDTPLHDFGKREEKTIEAVDVGYESEGDLELRLIAGEESRSTRIVTLPKTDRAGGQQGGTRSLRKAANTSSRYHKVRLSNTDGCDFSVDYLALAPVFYTRRNQR